MHGMFQFKCEMRHSTAAIVVAAAAAASVQHVHPMYERVNLIPNAMRIATPHHKNNRYGHNENMHVLARLGPARRGLAQSRLIEYVHS